MQCHITFQIDTKGVGYLIRYLLFISILNFLCPDTDCNQSAQVFAAMKGTMKM